MNGNTHNIGQQHIKSTMLMMKISYLLKIGNKKKTLKPNAQYMMQQRHKFGFPVTIYASASNIKTSGGPKKIKKLTHFEDQAYPHLSGKSSSFPVTFIKLKYFIFKPFYL